MKKRSRRNRRPRRRSRPHPRPRRYEAAMGRIESAFVSPTERLLPAFGSVYPGGGFTLGGATAISTAARRFGIFSALFD